MINNKKVFAVFLSIIMIITMMPTAVFAVDANTSGIKDSGNAGEYVNWILYNDGECVVRGKGEMNYSDLGFDGAPAKKYSDMIKSVTIENGVTTVDNFAFNDCALLENVVFPDSLSEIGSNAFANCTSLKSLVLPEGVKIIDSSAFENCSSLTTITIPSSVLVIHSYVFKDCFSLRNVIVSEENNRYSTDGHGGLFNKDKTELILYTPNENETEYIIPDSVTSIEQDAFSHCPWLTSITIPASMTDLSGGLFYACTAIEKFKVDANNPVYSVDEYGAVYNKDKTEIVVYPQGSKRIEYKIADGVKTIGNHAFFGCKYLENVVIPNSVSTIERDAFRQCASLKNITIPDSVESLGECIFKDCEALESVKIGNRVRVIPLDSFRNCQSLSSVSIGSSVGNISEAAFADCVSLESITVPNSVGAIEYCAFQGCSSLSSIILSENMYKIGYNAFDGCSSLRDVYCTGSEEDWNTVEIFNDNNCNDFLLNAQFHYNYISDDPSLQPNYGKLILVDNSDIYVEDNCAILKPEMTLEDVMAQIKNEKIEIYDKNMLGVFFGSYVGTGCYIRIFGFEDVGISGFLVIVPMDVNGDAKVTAADARLALRKSAQLEGLSWVCEQACDTNHDGIITAADARTILRAAAKLDY